MTILGIDPSLYGTGWALVQCNPNGCYISGSGTIKIKKKVIPKCKHLQRTFELGILYKQFSELLQLHRFDLTCFAIEVPISLPGQQTPVLWQVQGLIRGILGDAGLSGGYYDPGEVKAAVTGSRKAEKDVVARFVLRQLTRQYKFGGNDESDAAAVALTHWRRQNWIKLSDTSKALSKANSKANSKAESKAESKANAKQKRK